MNRTGLLIALGVAVLTALLFTLYPEFDLALANLFYDPATRSFPLSQNRTAEFVRRAAMWIAWAIAAPAIIALVVKLIWPRKPLLISGRTMAFLLITIVLTAGVLSNALFKQNWGRPRPVATVEFSGPHAFKPWWDPRGACVRNCSFFSGEAVTAFWTYAPAALTPPAFRALAYAGATVFGLATGALRMSFGGHYATDVLIAGVVAFLVAWLFHGVFYRWAGPGFTDQRIDQAIGNAVLAWRRWLSPPPDPVLPDTGLPKAFWWLVVALGALTVFRIAGLSLSVVDLFYDEAQYWAWAQAPAWGYFSKPPVLAWVIAATGQVCGSSEACIRSASPVLHFATTIVTYFIALRLYGARVALWSALCLALGPGLIFSTRIISTDVPLLLCWAVALLAYVRLLDEPGWRWGAVLGVALGFGLLAKYAMIYFVLGAVLAAIVDPRARTLLRQPGLWLAAALALAIVTPNLIWNANHDFVTFRHTQDNIGGGGLQFDLLHMLSFVASQFGVFGPIMFATFLLAVFFARRFDLQPSDRLMIAFALPPLVLVAITAFVSHANANWAAPSVISLTIVAVAILVRGNQRRWLQATIAIGLAVQLILPAADAFANRISLTFRAKPDIYSRTMGWRALSEGVGRVAQASGARSVVAEQRDVIASLIYYLRRDPWLVLSWRTSASVAHHFDIDRPLTPSAPEPVLYVTDCPSPSRLLTHFNVVEWLGPIDAASGPRSSRRLFAYKLSGNRGNTAPLGPCAPWPPAALAR